MGLKITVYMCSQGKLWTKDKKKKKNQTNCHFRSTWRKTGLWEQNQGIEQVPCTEHHQRGKQNT